MPIFSLGEYDVRFAITITSKESVKVSPEMRERVKKLLQDHLKEPKLIGRIEQHLGLSQLSEAECVVNEVHHNKIFVR